MTVGLERADEALGVLLEPALEPLVAHGEPLEAELAHDEPRNAEAVGVRNREQPSDLRIQIGGWVSQRPLGMSGDQGANASALQRRETRARIERDRSRVPGWRRLMRSDGS